MKTYDPEGKQLDELPQTGEGVRGETLGGSPNIEIIEKYAPRNAQEYVAKPSSMPMKVSQAEVLAKSRQYWEPAWGASAAQTGNQAPPITQGPKADKTDSNSEVEP
jgi:hypothetical protein